MNTPEQELNDIAELSRLAEENGAKAAKLRENGAQISEAGWHYVICLLETLLATSPIDLLLPAKLAHERWMAEQLAAAERSYASVMAARAEHERRQREEAIRRGAPATTPAGPQPALKNADLLHRMAAKTDAKAKRQ
jgi:hypothetical protein